MHVGLLFYADTIAMALDPASIKGRAVANHGFVEALIKNGTSHRITIIVGSGVETELVHHFFGELLDAPHVSIVTFTTLASTIASKPLNILHVLGPDLYRGFTLRNSFGLNCPVTGVTHSLGHSPYLEWLEINLRLASDSRDRLICTTPTAQEAVIKMIETFVGAAPRGRPGKHGGLPLQTEIIPLGIHTANYQTKTESLRSKLVIPEDAIIILYLGRFSYYTKVDLLPLLLAFRNLSQVSSHPVHLVLAGATGGEDYEKIIMTAADEWGVRGWTHLSLNPSEEDKRVLLHDADIFVAPGDNYQETFGLSVVEAMASGLPVIASDWDGYRSLVEDGQTGFLIPTLALAECDFIEKLGALLPDSIAHLYFSQAVATRHEIWEQRLLQVVEDNELRQQMGKAARERSQKFSWKEVIGQYFILWQKLTALPPPAPETKKTMPMLHHLQVFGGYATEKLKSTHRLSLTAIGRQMVAGKLPLRLYTAAEDILEIPLLGSLLKVADGEITMAEIVANLAGRFPEDKIYYHVIWMCKYGMIGVL